MLLIGIVREERQKLSRGSEYRPMSPLRRWLWFVVVIVQPHKEVELVVEGIAEESMV